MPDKPTLKRKCKSEARKVKLNSNARERRSCIRLEAQTVHALNCCALLGAQCNASSLNAHTNAKCFRRLQLQCERKFAVRSGELRPALCALLCVVLFAVRCFDLAFRGWLRFVRCLPVTTTTQHNSKTLQHNNATTTTQSTTTATAQTQAEQRKSIAAPFAGSTCAAFV